LRSDKQGNLNFGEPVSCAPALEFTDDVRLFIRE